MMYRKRRLPRDAFFKIVVYSFPSIPIHMFAARHPEMKGQGPAPDVHSDHLLESRSPLTGSEGEL